MMRMSDLSKQDKYKTTERERIINTLSEIHKTTSKDFNNAWEQAISNTLIGNDIVFGSLTEPKKARDSIQLISLHGHAIEQIENKELHPKATFKNVDEYCKEFTREYQLKQDELPDGDSRKHIYTYYDRLTRTSLVGENQLKQMKMHLAQQRATIIPSNRTQAITWIPDGDPYVEHSPCLQRIWLRWYEGDYIDVHFNWRSRDLINAWQVNIIALVDMLNREVIKPNNCQIARIVDYSDSLHIYQADLKYAQSIVPIR
jgi:thymidylate synthase